MEEAAKEAKLRRDETADDERAEKERARTHVDASEHDVKAVPAASDPSEKALQKQQAKKKSSQNSAPY